MSNEKTKSSSMSAYDAFFSLPLISNSPRNKDQRQERAFYNSDGQVWEGGETHN